MSAKKKEQKKNVENIPLNEENEELQIKPKKEIKAPKYYECDENYNFFGSPVSVEPSVENS